MDIAKFKYICNGDYFTIEEQKSKKGKPIIDEHGQKYNGPIIEDVAVDNI